MIEYFDIDKLSGEQIQCEIADLLAKGYRRHVQEGAKAQTIRDCDLMPVSRGRDKVSQGVARNKSTSDLAAGG